MESSQFPHQIIKETVHLYQKFCQLLNIKLPTVRATGIHFFYKFYQRTRSNPPEHALTAISCFNLAAKVCDISISYKRYVNEIKSSPRTGITGTFFSIFQVLDGIPPSNTPNFHDILLKKLIDKEMQIILNFEFDFSAQLPYDISIVMIDKILKWHIQLDDPTFLLLHDEIVQKCWTFFNDLQFSEIFYTSSPELIAISSIELTFLLLDIPLISPSNCPWFAFLVFDVDIEKSKKLTSDIKKLFSLLFYNLNKNSAFKLKTSIDKNCFKNWIHYPLIPLKKVPICLPPSLELLQSIVFGDDSFKKCEYDHVPQFPPPNFD